MPYREDARDDVLILAGHAQSDGYSRERGPVSVRAVDVISGETQWETSLGLGDVLAMNVGKHIVAVATRAPNEVAIDLQCLNKETGSSLWTTHIQGRGFLSHHIGILIERNQVILSRARDVICFGSGGEQLWTQQVFKPHVGTTAETYSPDRKTR